MFYRRSNQSGRFLLRAAASAAAVLVLLPTELHAQSSGEILPELRTTYDPNAYRLRPMEDGSTTDENAEQTNTQATSSRTGLRSRARTRETTTSANSETGFRTRSRLPQLPTLADRANERRAARDRSQNRSPSRRLAVGASGIDTGDPQTSSDAGTSNGGPIGLSEPTVLAARPEVPTGPVTDENAVTGSVSDESPSVRANTPALLEQGGNPATPEEDPFLPVGFRLGTTIMDLRLEQYLGATDNYRLSADGDSATFSETDAQARLRSDWSRHELQITASGTYRTALDDGDELEFPTADIDASLRLDLIDGWTLTGTAGYGFAREDFSSRELGANVADAPDQEEFSGSVEIARTGNRLDLSLRGSISQVGFTDAKLDDGTKFDQSDRDSTTYEVIARAGYELSPAVKPFIEGRYGERHFDRSRDRNGIERDSQFYELRGGVELDFGEKLTGEIAVGYFSEEFDDSALEGIDGFSLNGNITWSPERDTIVTLDVATGRNASTIAGNSGSVSYSADLGLERQITDRWSMRLNAGFDVTQSDDLNETDTTWNVGARTEYWLSRYWGVAAEIDHERFDADDSDRSYDATTAKIGVIWQR